MPSVLPVRSKVKYDLSNTFFVAALLCLFLAEAFMVHRLWLASSTPALHRHGVDLPFLIWIPAVCAFFFLQLIRRRTGEGHISPSFAATLSSGITLLLLIAYLLITRFAQIAFR